MGKDVVVIASGETERRALPHLVAHLRAEEITLIEVRIPPGGRALNLDMAEKLVKASWFERVNAPPDKFVVLVDTDGKIPHEVLRPFQEQLQTRIPPKIIAQFQYAHAQQHLEAWYFADIRAMRGYLDRDEGNVDASRPDEIQNPKLHLKHLLGQRAYTAVVSEEIARRVDPQVVYQRSPSFHGFVEAVRNGSSLAPDQADQ
jgi:hypothetical protein